MRNYKFPITRVDKRKITINYLTQLWTKMDDGVVIQPGVFLPLQKYFFDSKTGGYFALYIMKCIESELCSLRENIEEKYNQRIFDALDGCVELGEKFIDNSCEENRRKLKAKSEELYAIQPGWKRVSIHATRRKSLSRELLVVEEALDCLSSIRSNNWVYGFCVSYVFNYVNYRYKVCEMSKTRVDSIIEYFEYADSP